MNIVECVDLDDGVHYYATVRNNTVVGWKVIGGIPVDLNDWSQVPPHLRGEFMQSIQSLYKVPPCAVALRDRGLRHAHPGGCGNGRN